ncbi:MAG TPA: hypothetical protein VJ228_07400 [Candidatus Acidoferrales bacterium]|nr:hypothetical protein [Candidatus Acidoferrales bacterium]
MSIYPPIPMHDYTWVQLLKDNPEWALVIVGIVTFVVIGWQSWATACAAKAAQISAEALWAGQRAQLAADAHGNPIKDLLSDTPRVQLELVNRGLTPAYSVCYETWLEILPFPFEDFTSSADYFKTENKIALYSNHAPLVINIPFAKGLTETQRDDIRKLRQYVCVRLRAEYRDVRTSGRYADFGFWVEHDGLGFLPRYNDAN